MSFKPYATFDYSEKPIIKVTLTGEKATDENFEAYLEETHLIPEMMEYKQFAVLMDISSIKYLEAKYRLMQGQALKDNEENTKKYSLGIAMIAP